MQRDAGFVEYTHLPNCIRSDGGVPTGAASHCFRVPFRSDTHFSPTGGPISSEEEKWVARTTRAVTIGITTTKESLHDRSYPGRALKPALVSARPRACFSFVGVELRNRLWRRRDKPLSIAKKREVPKPLPRLTRMCDSRPSAEQSNGMKIEPTHVGHRPLHAADPIGSPGQAG